MTSVLGKGIPEQRKPDRDGLSWSFHFSPPYRTSNLRIVVLCPLLSFVFGKGNGAHHFPGGQTKPMEVVASNGLLGLGFSWVSRLAEMGSVPFVFGRLFVGTKKTHARHIRCHPSPPLDSMRTPPRTPRARRGRPGAGSRRASPLYGRPGPGGTIFLFSGGC